MDSNETCNENRSIIGEPTGNREHYTILTHNCSGYEPTIHKPMLQHDTIDFVLLQETFHFDSDKGIYDDFQKFKTFQTSGMDENVVYKKWQGGLITYVNNRISSEVKLIAKAKRYLIITVGKLALINVYLPHQNYHDKDLYENCLAEITRHIEELDESHAFIIAGDFNASGRNLKEFRNFNRKFRLVDWSDNIPYTYAQNCKSGMAESTVSYTHLTLPTKRIV